MRLYSFDGVDREFKLLPLAARRALDLVGRHLGLEGFLSLPLEARALLAKEGSRDEPNLATVLGVVAGATPHASECPVIADPDPERIPVELAEALGERSLPLDVWRKLSPLDRASLVKVASRRKSERLEAAYLEIVEPALVSTHLRQDGGVHMVSIAGKPVTERRAVAEALVTFGAEAFARLVARETPKGDVLGTARLAGIMATKKTSDLVPLCHPLPLDHADIAFEFGENTIVVRCTTETTGKTGVEMEAMTGAMIAALTLYDMMKSLDRGIVIGPVRLLHKSGGRSGTYEGTNS